MMSPLIRVSSETYERLKEWAGPWETQDDTVRRVLEKAGAPVRVTSEPTRREPREISSVQDYVALMSDAAATLWNQLESRLPEVGDDIGVGVTPQYIKLMVAGRNFAEVHRRKAGLMLLVHPHGHEDIAPGSRTSKGGVPMRRAAANAGWTLDTFADLTRQSELDYAVTLLQASYSAVKRRAG